MVVDERRSRGRGKNTLTDEAELSCWSIAFRTQCACSCWPMSLSARFSRWDRFVDNRRPHAEAGRAPGQDFHRGFRGSRFDESPHAHAVARHLGTDHSELFVSSAEAQGVIKHCPPCMTGRLRIHRKSRHLVCAARRQVTVALSGDGGDELFGGYNRYFWGPRIWNRLSWMPYPCASCWARPLAPYLSGLDALVGAKVSRAPAKSAQAGCLLAWCA